MKRGAAAELILDSRAMVGEGPIWDHRRGKLLWVDIPANAVHEFDPRSGADTVSDVGQPVGAVGLCKNGGLVAAVRDGFAVLPPGGPAVSDVIEVEKDRPGSRMNDGKCDCRGRFWAGTMAWEHTPGAGSLYCLQRAEGCFRVSTVLRDITIANGLDWSPDHQRMYYIDSATQRIDVFDFNADRGTVENRRTFVEILPAVGLPDGMTVDAEGGVWVALFGGGKVRRYTADGRVDLEVRLPVTLATSCAFGGPELDELYITTARHRLTREETPKQPTAGGIFVCRPGPVGRLPFLFDY